MVTQLLRQCKLERLTRIINSLTNGHDPSVYYVVKVLHDDELYKVTFTDEFMKIYYKLRWSDRGAALFIANALAEMLYDEDALNHLAQSIHEGRRANDPELKLICARGFDPRVDQALKLLIGENFRADHETLKFNIY